MMRGSGRTVCAAILIVIGLLALPSRAQASQLVPPGVGAQDVSLAGNVVALPLNSASALFHNPAQLALLPNSVTGSLLAIRYHPRYANPLGYDNTSRELPLAPALGYVTDRWAPFHVGIGMYGSLGFTYNFDADPARGVPNNFFTELAVISLAAAVAYSPTPNLHLGAALNPSYGRLRFKTPSPVGRIDVDVRGPGVFATLGLLYTPTPKLSLGIGYKTPGTIFMFGNARVAGRGDNARVDFQFPQVLEFGAAYHFTDRLTVVAQGRWAGISAFEDTELRFDQRTFLNRTAVNDARDRFRLGGGVQYVLFPGVTFQVGFSWERWAIKSSSLAPTLFDLTEYYMFPVGISIDRGSWQIDLSAGQSYTESRRVIAERNPFFPGRYALDQAIFCAQVTYRLGKREQVSTF